MQELEPKAHGGLYMSGGGGIITGFYSKYMYIDNIWRSLSLLHYIGDKIVSETERLLGWVTVFPPNLIPHQALKWVVGN